MRLPGGFGVSGPIMANLAKTKVKAAVSVLVALACFCGCAHQYLIRLNNGGQILAISKPKLQGTNYYYTDNMGAKCVIPEDRVARIRAVSVEKPEQQPVSAPSSPKPKQPKHWYFLWLA